MTDTKNDQVILMYFADPMCSWCWGFAPVMEQAHQRFENDMHIQLVLGGLRISGGEPIDQRMKQEIREHWQHVNELSGQPFDYGFFERERFVYDTEPASRAVIAVRAIDSQFEKIFFHRIQKAFYTENQDVTDAEILSQLATEIGVERTQFQQVFDDPQTAKATTNEFAIAKRAGIGGFPTLVIGTQEAGLEAVTVGYQAWPIIETKIQTWLDQHRQVTPEAP